MTHVNRSASRKNAKCSRQAGECVYEAERPRQLWRVPLRLARRAIDSTVVLVELADRLIGEVERFADGHPLRSTRQLQRVSGLLDIAHAKLGRAARGLGATSDSALLNPENAAEAPELLTENTLLWLVAAEKLKQITDRWGYTSIWLSCAVKIGAIQIDLSELLPDKRPAIAPPRPNPTRLFLALHRSCKSDCLQFFLLRRRRLVPAAFAEAARRVFRGRAPPVVSACSL
jgi:hypothetical protein